MSGVPITGTGRLRVKGLSASKLQAQPLPSIQQAAEKVFPSGDLTRFDALWWQSAGQINAGMG
jgi:hypothetical protein